MFSTLHTIKQPTFKGTLTVTQANLYDNRTPTKCSATFNTLPQEDMQNIFFKLFPALNREQKILINEKDKIFELPNSTFKVINDDTLIIENTIFQGSKAKLEITREDAKKVNGGLEFFNEILIMIKCGLASGNGYCAFDESYTEKIKVLFGKILDDFLKR